LEKIKKNPFIYLLILGISLWLASIPVVVHFYGQPNTPNEFGDMFGAINALFSGLALAGIIYAIIIQRQELILTREELARTAKAQIASASALEKQLELQVDASRLTALSALVNSANEQINQHDRWNEKQNKRNFDNKEVLEKRRNCESEIWTLLEKCKNIK
jgi:hypothetical protein